MGWSYRLQIKESAEAKGGETFNETTREYDTTSKSIISQYRTAEAMIL